MYAKGNPVNQEILVPGSLGEMQHFKLYSGTSILPKPSGDLEAHQGWEVPWQPEQSQYYMTSSGMHILVLK